jgi:septal ring factor EnvC (AmiA/AmiB activator)
MLAVRAASQLKMNRSIPCIFVLFFSAFGWGPGLRATPVETSDSAAATAKLAEVRRRIAALTARLGDELKDRDALAARLREAELTITAKRRQLDGLRAEQAATLRRRAELGGEQARNQSALDAERAALEAEVRAAYMIGQQDEIKLLLNQNDPASTGRMLAFYGYFARARSARIDAIGMRVARLLDLAAELREASAKLGVLEAATRADMNDLQHARALRLAALGAVKDQVQSGTEELKRLKREERAEEALLADLARVLQDFPVESQQSFDTLRGRLPWPVTGKLDPGRSGQPQNGVLIDAALGTKVRAPYFGRVVYADWLQGLGLLLIIGHGGNYMTLYGHAEVLYKSVGDWVAPGDIIAALRDSGGGTPQLYFEIREGRKALDPKRWLKAAP